MREPVFSGLEACARALTQVVEVVALIGGEGARRLANTLAVVDSPRPVLLPERGRDAATAALGLIAAGRRVALLASGRDAVCALLPALRELAALSLPAIVVVPSHADEDAPARCDDGRDDVEILQAILPRSVLHSSSARLVSSGVSSASAVAVGARKPVCVTFDFERVGLAIEALDLPVTPPSLHIELAWNEPTRSALARAIAAEFASGGVPTLTRLHDPWRASIAVYFPADASQIRPARIVVAEPGSLGLRTVLEHAPDDASVALLGPCDPETLAALREVCERRTLPFRHEPEATLRP